MSTAIGPFDVIAEAGEIVAFRAATGLPPGEAPPATFPMRWLADARVRDAVAGLVEADMVPVHESQSFDHRLPLAAGETYRLALAARRESAPDRLIVDGTITGGRGDVHVALETILRLFSIAAAA